MNLTHFLRKREWAAVCATIAGILTTALLAAEDPLVLVRGYFDAPDAATRASFAARLARHGEFKPSRLPGWLHKAASFPDTDTSSRLLKIDVGTPDPLGVYVVLPDNYRPDRAWPLIYALHPSGQAADVWSELARNMLGRRAGEFIIAAPNGYRQNYIAAEEPFNPEHPAILDALARRFHIDAARVYAFGYSKGAFGAWFVSLYYPDRLAGAIALAGTFDVAVADDGFWKHVVMNAAHVPVYNVWGERDPLVARALDGTPVGTFAEQNRRFAKEVGGLGLPFVNVEVPGGDHSQLAPPVQPIVDILAMRRVEDPRRISHTFRHLHQASSYWLEGLTWVGDAWGIEQPKDVSAIEPLLGRLTGTIDGQTVRVTRRHIGDVVIWFGERTVDWDKTVRVEVDGMLVFEGRITRDVGVALTRAAATRDFDTLRWAGLRVSAAGHAVWVTADTMPAPAWRSAMK